MAVARDAALAVLDAVLAVLRRRPPARDEEPEPSARHAVPGVPQVPQVRTKL